MSFTAISSRRTSSCSPTARPGSSTSASRSCSICDDDASLAHGNDAGGAAAYARVRRARTDPRRSAEHRDRRVRARRPAVRDARPGRKPFALPGGRRAGARDSRDAPAPAPSSVAEQSHVRARCAAISIASCSWRSERSRTAATSRPAQFGEDVERYLAGRPVRGAPGLRAATASRSSSGATGRLSPAVSAIALAVSWVRRDRDSAGQAHRARARPRRARAGRRPRTCSHPHRSLRARRTRANIPAATRYASRVCSTTPRKVSASNRRSRAPGGALASGGRHADGAGRVRARHCAADERVRATPPARSDPTTSRRRASATRSRRARRHIAAKRRPDDARLIAHRAPPAAR